MAVAALRVRKRCPHGREHYYCRDCGGGGICEHKRHRSACKECGGISFCEHGRRRSVCKECGGTSICEHGRERCTCKECGGTSICEHGRRRGDCKECGGASICEHGHHRVVCKECGGSSICVHGRRRSVCKECGGASICEHGRQRRECKECGGSSICEHEHRRTTCKECGGASICEHGRQRNLCRDCDGVSMCEHGRKRRVCKECLDLNARLESGVFCIVCSDVYVSQRRRRAGIKMCAQCDAAAPKRIELIVRPLLIDAIGVAATIADDATLGGAGCDASVRRPDLLFVRAGAIPDNIAVPGMLIDGRIVCVEIDEQGGHPDNDPSCESGKMWDQTVALKRLCGETTRIFFVRFNPDAYDAQHVTLDDRIATVATHVRELLEDGWYNFETANVPHVSYHYYHSKCQHHINYVRARPDSFNIYYVGPTKVAGREIESVLLDENESVVEIKRYRVNDE